MDLRNLMQGSRIGRAIARALGQEPSRRPPMHAAKLLVATAFALTATLADAAGFRFIVLPADADGPAARGAIWYPCSEPQEKIDLDPYTLSVAKDCPISGDRLPLVVISHGRGGSFLNFYDLANTLADAGFIVAAINHPGDTALDKSRSSNLSVFAERPTDIKRVITLMLTASPAASKIDPERIGFFGFSRGGYTGLVLAGANADWDSARVRELCQTSSEPLCEQIRRKEFPAQPLAHDSRIKAAVVADPLAVFFTAGNLAAIQVPVQLWASERGGDGVILDDVAVVARSLLTKHEFHVVAKSGHFAFMMCPPAMANAVSELCRDEPGFDRVNFHKQLNTDVLAFFQTELSGK
jgi:predicted dienelactone hydrolase